MAEVTSDDSLLDILELVERIDRQTVDLTREAFLFDAAPSLTVWGGNPRFPD